MSAIKYYRIVLLTGVILLLFFSSPAPASKGVEQKKVTVVFRFDDPSARSCTEIEDKLIVAFRKYNMHCTFGVIPFVSAGDVHDTALQGLLPLTPAKVEILRQAVQEGVLEIALHGYSHQTNGLMREGYSEFAGLDYEEQLKRIEEGKQFLEAEFGNPVTIFVPPWNTYDANTLRVLEQKGFKCLSANTYGFANPSSPLEFLPATCSIWQLDDAIASARKLPDPASVIVVLFHEYDFREVNQEKGRVTYNGFTQILERLSQQEDIEVQPIGRIQNAFARRYTENQGIVRIHRLLPPLLPATSYPLVYWSLKGSWKVRLRQRTLLACLYGSWVLAVCALSF